MRVHNDSLDTLHDFGCMVTIWAGQYGLPSFQNIFICKMEKCSLLSIVSVIICMSAEQSGHQHSETAVTIFMFGLWTEL